MDKLTLSEAVEQGIDKLRREPWSPSSRIELHRFPDGLVGPWVTVRDRGTDRGHYEPGKVLFVALDPHERAWEQWTADREDTAWL